MIIIITFVEQGPAHSAQHLKKKNILCTDANALLEYGTELSIFTVQYMCVVLQECKIRKVQLSELDSIYNQYDAALLEEQAENRRQAKVRARWWTL